MLPPTLQSRLDRVSTFDPPLADELADAFSRLLQAGDALVWARERLPMLLSAAGANALLSRVVDEAHALTAAPEVWAMAWEGRAVQALAGRSASGALARTVDGALLTPDGLSRSVVGGVVAAGRPVWSEDAAADARFVGAASVQHVALRSVGCVPVGRGAVLYLYDPHLPGRFLPESQARLTALCALAGLVLDARQHAHVAPAAVEALPGLVGSAPAMRELFAAVRAFAPMPWPCLILGETGTGKEAVAAAIHALSPRAGGPFVPVNCGAIPVDLAESLLFGHEQGAFTGAHKRTDGLVTRAAGGTLFLDEVGDLPALVQVKLLRLLQEGRYSRVGGQAELTFSGRVVAATHKDVTAPADFRGDLYHRLSACVLRVPPLRDRRSDIPALAQHLLGQALGELPGMAALTLSAGAVDALGQRAWPGNVRELGNALRGAVARCYGRGGVVVEASDLGEVAAPPLAFEAAAEWRIDAGVGRAAGTPAGPACTVASPGDGGAARVPHGPHPVFPPVSPPVSAPISPPVPHGPPGPGEADLPPASEGPLLLGDLQRATAAFQRQQVEAALAAAHGNRTRAAELLGVSRQWLHRLISREDEA